MEGYKMCYSYLRAKCSSGALYCFVLCSAHAHRNNANAGKVQNSIGGAERNYLVSKHTMMKG